ncbi:hypothetical protein BJV82DRAFT_335620 [Fennellomyces sp. T-0311]|nr:hypothetical protein BJV82DRAFT_335620 [Fennellomyces sp. T-0311]
MQVAIASPFILHMVCNMCVTAEYKSSSFPSYSLETDTARAAFSKVGAAIDSRDYIQAVTFASKAIEEIQERQLITALDHRAYALGMQGKFGAAVRDAEDMIKYKPGLATGYNRLGWLYAVQGKQQKAIDTYTAGLRNVAHDDPQFIQLGSCKWEATKQSSNHVDFIAKLPVEVAFHILADLPKDTKIICLGISSIWRRRLLECSSAWAVVTVDSRDNTTTSALPHIARHVNDLTISTENWRIWHQYKHSMENGRFSKIKSLALKEGANHQYFNLPAPASLTMAFRQMGPTLTTLKLALEQKHSKGITLADILYLARNLTRLEYTAKAPLANVLGDLTVVSGHHALQDMQLHAQSITSQSIEPLLRTCRNIRRLALRGCHESVLDAIKVNCRRLEILGFNSKEVEALDHLPARQHNIPGLRALYTSTEADAIPLDTLSELLIENMRTLETVYADVVPDKTLVDLSMVPLNNLNLSGLKKLRYWSDTGGGRIERDILKSISKCTALSHVEARDISLVSELLDVLMVLPPVKTFGLSFTCEEDLAVGGLISLFRKYAAIPAGHPNLEVVRLQECKSVTYTVLSTLARIQTLRDITLCRLDGLSDGAINDFLRRLGDNVSAIELCEMESVADIHLLTLGELQGLTCVALNALPNATNYGVQSLVDKAKRLRKLKIVKCASITSIGVTQARRKIETVEVINE